MAPGDRPAIVGGSFYTIKLKSACRKPDLSLSGLDPVSLSKIETHLLASLGSKGKNRNSLACLRNAGFHSAESYCITRWVSFRVRGQSSPHRAMQRLSPGRARDHPVMDIVPNNALSLSLSLSRGWCQCRHGVEREEGIGNGSQGGPGSQCPA